MKPDETSTREIFETYLDRLTAVAEAHSDVVGVVAFGSTADRGRVDEWSDHDFAWITAPGSQDRYRYDLGWLPDADRIALSVVESHGGVKVIYDDGHVLEFGIATTEDFSGWAGNSTEVIFDRGGVAEANKKLRARTSEETQPDAARDARLFVSHLLIGVGRARRGELLSASQLIRSEAVSSLLRVLAQQVAAGGSGGGSAAGAASTSDAPRRLDSLDSRRRFDFVHPELAARIESAVRQSPEDCARSLLALAEETLHDWEGFPRDGVVAVRRRLNWPT